MASNCSRDRSLSRNDLVGNKGRTGAGRGGAWGFIDFTPRTLVAFIKHIILHKHASSEPFMTDALYGYATSFNRRLHSNFKLPTLMS